MLFARSLFSCFFILALFSCQNRSQEAKALKEELTQDSSYQQKRPPRLAGERTTKNAGIDTLIGRNRYQLSIKADSLWVQKNNLSLRLALKGQQKKLAALLFEAPQADFRPIHQFSDSLFVCGSFDGKNQQLHVFREREGQLLAEEKDAAQNPLETLGQYLIYLPSESVLAIPSQPIMSAKPMVVIRRYKVNELDMLLPLRSDTIYQN
ncbi:hypothetical protein PPO43_08995 [Saprospira sp. CCB-QB6]|uniref:hypothetical protein n=1 Tax=Saprospira sp. CCB-QB6 TaxID=3023936 RepID=UPI002349F53C|nr:hypothetical protein [Saprospira sp. CCB-QB6]WCL80112.1 hypothetical protein PPO43_08995 [Saprospira sp. CCB-QB6]